MIVEALIASATAVTLGGLWFADRLLKRESPPPLPPTASTSSQLEELKKSRDRWLTEAKKSHRRRPEQRSGPSAKAGRPKINAIIMKGGS